MFHFSLQSYSYTGVRGGWGSKEGFLHVTSRSWKAVLWPPDTPVGESDLGAEDGGWRPGPGLGLGLRDTELTSCRGMCLESPATSCLALRT